MEICLQNIIAFYNIEQKIMQNQTHSNPEYTKINGCSHPLPISQILAVSLLVIILIIHFNLIPSIVSINQGLLYGLLAFDYLLLLIVVTLYLYVVLMDPADPRLKNKTFKQAGEKLKFCSQCQVQVNQTSYHCKICHRCVQKFDHHCVYVNNCIGSQNYSIFVILLLSLIIYTSTNIGIGLWIIFSVSDSYRWVALTFCLLSFLVFIEITVLTVFHTYISFFLYKTTLQVLRGGKVQDQNSSDKKTIILHVNAQKIQEQSKLQMGRKLSAQVAVKTQMPLQICEQFS